ncbi:Uncharacterized protein Rs2_33908 [Raphanus sativus]|uniref:Uncharacterized protein LOC108817712 n=1 Tax=Raphanus sativus TaxID=3726 RepID=A0A6J0KEM0_RAPSA|nr:uncharacterized protein LOC108817712 [Raphanus sativus]KAJ4883815.1 Uncharacterized protein Rs2_33908 [Raphanus sativus]
MVSDKQLSPVGGSSVPVPNRMLRLLKKASSISDLCPGSGGADGEDLGKDGLHSAKGLDGVEEEEETREGLGVEEDGVNARKALDFDSVPELNPAIEDLGEETEEVISDLETREETRVSESSVPEIDSTSEELGEKSEEEISEMETREEARVLESSVLDFDPASEELSKGGEDEISEMETREETRVTESSVPEIYLASEELGEKSEEEIPDLETREETRVSESSVSEELGERGEDQVSDEMETEEGINVWGSKGVRKKRSVLDTSNNQGKKAKKSKKTVDFDELPASMNMTKKERREYLDQLRAENQRLLRETRDAAFEPVPLVRKPISSVLEKIRRRKEEISKQFLSRKKSKSMDVDDGPFGEDVNDFEEVVIEEENEDVNLEFKSTQNSHGQDSAGPLGNSDSPSNKKSESNSTHQDPSLRSQTTNFGEERLEKTTTRSVEEVMTPPSVPANKLKRNPSPAPDNSEEADYTKESYDPETHDSSPGDPVRKFIDEVAEEEDDSDNDLLRFEDDDDEDEDEEDDDLRDMIASQFKEDPNDKYKRNELHQKWLEQQDAAGTEKLLHKLKRGLEQDKTSLFEDEDDDAGDEQMAEDADDVEVSKPEASEDENEEDPSHATSMRMRIKKIKEMIPLMFTDENDVYVSSDDEETEKKLLQQRLYKKRLEQKAKFSSSTGDENSEEILRHIKKPEIGKKAKPTSFKDRALMGMNKNPAPSMASFLGKLTKSSISEGSRKRGSNVVRGYIFERDDSNSKSLNSVPEEPSVPETIVQEKSRPRRAPAKFTASQSQDRSTTSQATTTAEEEKSTRQRTTLYEILKMSSKKTSFTSGETVISSSHTESIFAAFKLDTKLAKTNPQGQR